MKRAGVYARVSTSDQREEGTSLDTQRDEGLAKARELGWDVSANHIILEDWTGTDLQRPGLTRLMDLARSGAISGVVIHTLDRLYRPESDGDEWRVFEVLQVLEDAGVEVAWVDPSIPPSGPLSSIFTFLDAWRAGRERRAIVERMTRGRLEKARRGRVVSSASASYGYRFDAATSTLVVQEDEAKVVRLMFHLYTQERLSVIQLADRLNRLGIGRPRGGVRWHASGMGRFLGNEAYAGTLWQNRWQRTKVVTKPGQRPVVKTTSRPKSEQIAVDVPAIVTTKVFEAAQKRLRENLALARRNTKRQYLLSGLVRHSCGSRIGPKSVNGMVYYRCYKNDRSRADVNARGEPQLCRSEWINGRELEAAVWDTVVGVLQTPELLERELRGLANPNSTTREALEAELAQMRDRLETLPREERRLMEGYRKGLYPDYMMREEMDRVSGERATAEQSSRELETQLARLDKALSHKGRVQDLACRLTGGLERMDFNDRRELLRLLVDEVIYDAGLLTIKTVLPLEQLQPVPGRGIQGDGSVCSRSRVPMREQYDTVSHSQLLGLRQSQRGFPLSLNESGG